MATAVPRIFPEASPIFPATKGSSPAQRVDILQGRGEKTFFYTTPGMEIDYDGGKGAYHLPTKTAQFGKPPGKDNILNASKSPKKTRVPSAGERWISAKWPQLVINKTTKFPYTYTIDGDQNYCVSKTTLHDPRPGLSDRDTAKWVDAMSIPYIVLPGNFWTEHGVVTGDLATVYNQTTGKIVHAIFADSGPRNHVGEGSSALAKALSPHDQTPLTWVVYPGSVRRPAWPVATTTINSEGQRLFRAWGGTLRIADMLIDEMQVTLNSLEVPGLPPFAIPKLRDILDAAQASIRASKGNPSKRDDAIGELDNFVKQVTASKTFPSRVAAKFRNQAERARTALSVPED
ncbi:hypothetical protein PPGU19_063590 (plasmid) [Paraburkholderia sp. PGU19]|uniref:glycoside hydrolase family 75 protein n=1 Tax=Paraburkholderia sp. PGU19 TaxID=2735434 RepID=UPI0015DA1CDE|nr:glycoside hydrolase family 75 protein [Paraburkholderia sp. PGU19]BCG01791.1 hypothetical protein PPGU19_063590 [Paraburkholderia sp. PGU19]